MTDAMANAELADWQKRLTDKKEELAKLQEGLAKAQGEKESVQQAVSAGATAAKAHMARLRNELMRARKRLAAHAQAQAILAAQQQQRLQEEQQRMEQADEGGEALIDPHGPAGNAGDVVDELMQPAVVPELSGAELDRQSAVRQALLQKERALRQEVERWKHQVAIQERQRPREEAQIVKLKAELTHQLDILESTRQAVQHEEVERDLARQGLVPSEADVYSQLLSMDPDSQKTKGPAVDAVVTGTPVPLWGGGHGGMEARAERHLRQRMEEESDMLSGKVKQLLGINAAQELLKQRLEKALIKEETELEQRERQLAFEVRRATLLQKNLRRRSDEAVAVALGFAGARRRAATAASATSLSAAENSHGGSYPDQSRMVDHSGGGAGAGPTSTVPYPEPCLQFGASASAPSLPPLEARG